MRQGRDVGIRGATAHEYNRTLHAARLAPGGEAAHCGGLPGSRMAGYDAYDFAVGGRRVPARIGGVAGTSLGAGGGKGASSAVRVKVASSSFNASPSLRLTWRS